MKFLIRAATLFGFIFFGCADVTQGTGSPIAVEEKAAQDREAERTLYEEIFWRYQDEDVLFDEKLRRRTADYLDFIRRFPESEFVPEAYLRIAEFLQLSGRKQAALPWLGGIIAYYPDDKYYSLTTHGYPGEKTSGWALYWRAVWFKGKTACDDLRRIVRENPADSKVVGDAGFELKKCSAKK